MGNFKLSLSIVGCSFEIENDSASIRPCFVSGYSGFIHGSSNAHVRFLEEGTCADEKSRRSLKICYWKLN
jgi:hypothetical protein